MILVHGLSSSRDVWRGLVDKLKGSHRFHLVQIGGYAGAPAGANADGPVVAPVAEEVARYITEFGLKQPAIIGHSMGGTIALMVAARHPGAVGKVMVVDMVPFMGVMIGGPAATPDSVRPNADQFRQQLLGADQAAYDARQAATIDTMVKTKAALPALVQHGKTSDRSASANAFHELVVTDLRPELSKITAPTTVLYVHTPQYPVSAEMLDAGMNALYANVKGVKLVRIPDAWHFLMIDQPERFATGSDDVPGRVTGRYCGGVAVAGAWAGAAAGGVAGGAGRGRGGGKSSPWWASNRLRGRRTASPKLWCRNGWTLDPRADHERTVARPLEPHGPVGVFDRAEVLHRRWTGDDRTGRGDRSRSTTHRASASAGAGSSAAWSRASRPSSSGGWSRRRTDARTT